MNLTANKLSVALRKRASKPSDSPLNALFAPPPAPFHSGPTPRKRVIDALLAPPAPLDPKPVAAGADAPKPAPVEAVASPSWWERNQDWALPTGIAAGGAIALGTLWHLLRKKRSSDA